MNQLNRGDVEGVEHLDHLFCFGDRFSEDADYGPKATAMDIRVNILDPPLDAPVGVANGVDKTIFDWSNAIPRLVPTEIARVRMTVESLGDESEQFEI